MLATRDGGSVVGYIVVALARKNIHEAEDVPVVDRVIVNDSVKAETDTVAVVLSTRSTLWLVDAVVGGQIVHEYPVTGIA